MKGRLKQLTGALLALLLCVSLGAPAAAADKSDAEIAAAALELISSHEGTYNSVSANDSGAVSVGKLQWHGERAHEVVRLAATYLGASGAVSILGQSFYNEIMGSSSWNSRKLNSTEAAAVGQLLSTDAGHRAEDDLGVRDLTGYINSGRSYGLSRPAVLVYYCDMYNHWPAESVKVAKSAVASVGSGAAVTLDVIHNTAMNSGFGNYATLRNKAYTYCSALGWEGGSGGLTAAPQPATGFGDVPVGSWYADAVKWAVDKGITNGTSSYAFSPDAVCTRAQAVTFLWRAYGSLKPTTTVQLFSDVNANDYYYNAVVWAAEQGITSGTGNGLFSPNQQCTRGEIVTFLWRAQGSPDAAAHSFSDVPVDSFCTTAVGWASANGITQGSDATSFAPNDPCTRAHIVTFLYRDMA
ncbi:MAG: S-layer homology domain-containing protein [Oscillospiraceae bacterium]|nr:S-layer homology domain-containing protein [Oscillospiraceae bacterium]